MSERIARVIAGDADRPGPFYHDDGRHTPAGELGWQAYLKEAEAIKLTIAEPTLEQVDRALHELGVTNPRESKQWLREFYRAMIRNA